MKIISLAPFLVVPFVLSSAMAGSISQSIAFPVVNQAVSLTISADLIGTPISVVGPLGSSQLVTDGQGLAIWTPTRYGKYTLTCGDATTSIWVTARPMKFHWWSCTQAQKNVTEIMASSPEWEARGVSQVTWTGGEAYSRGVDGHNWSTASEWYNGWSYAYTVDGMAVDEAYCEDAAPTNAIIDAITMVRQARGPQYSINLWSSGFGGNFASGAAKLKAANATVLIEDYYGTWNLHKQRWDAVRAAGLQNYAISGIWPGTSNLTNEAEIRTDVALVRLAEPSANGIAIFAPSSNLLDATDRAIEDYYLKPLIHLSVNASGQLIAWNLGNEDATGFSLQLLNNANGVVQTIDLSTLAANAKQTLNVPAGATKAKVLNPAGTANLYSGNSQYSNGIFPILIPGRYTWTHANGDNLWSTFSNWNPSGPPPGNIDSGNYAYFDGTASAPTSVTAPSGEISINSVQFTSGGWTINGNATTQDFYTYSVSSTGAGTNTINIGISARDVVPAAFNVGTGNTLVMNGLIGAVRNNGGVIKSGSGILKATYDNTFTGGVNLQGGQLVVSGSGSKMKSTGATIASGTTLELNVSSAFQDWAANVTFTGTGTLVKSGAGTFRIPSQSGTFNLGAGSQIDVQGGSFDAGSSANENWSSNLSSLNLAAGTSIDEISYSAARFDALTGAGTMNANGSAIVTIGANNTSAGTYNPAGSATFSGAITGAASFVKTGSGTQVLGGACSYTGTTAVNVGTLLIDGSLPNSATTVAVVGTLGGGGSIGGSVTNNGKLAPGSNGVGKLTINNTATLAGGSKLAWEVTDWTGAAGTGYDQLAATTLAITATSANPVTIQLKDIALANFTEANTSFVLVQSTSAITGFSADKFVVDASGLSIPQGSWAVQQSGNQLLLVYTSDANGNGILDVWEKSRFGNANAGTNQPNDDADHDGLTNLLEYALNCHPLTANPSPLACDYVPLADGQHLRLTVQKNHQASNLIYIVESCGALDDWSTSNVSVETNNEDVLIVRDNFTTTTAERRFIRLRVQTVP